MVEALSNEEGSDIGRDMHRIGSRGGQPKRSIDDETAEHTQEAASRKNENGGITMAFMALFTWLVRS